MRILILEDDDAVAGLYRATLEGAGHQVLVCPTFEAARKAVQEHTPDGLLADVRVGPYNGLQLALMFRAANAKGPVVVVSGHDDPVIQKEARKIRATFHLKPVELETLCASFDESSEAAGGKRSAS